MLIKVFSHFINPYIKVKKSGIHSKGVFARKNIPEGVRIIEYLGKEMTHEESDALYQKMYQRHQLDPSKASVYTFTLNDTTDINGGVWWNLARFINHSCEPNCEAVIEDEKSIVLYSARHITRGEELTFNYGYDVETWEDHPCRCGSAGCVGYIVAEEQWDTLRKFIAFRENHLSGLLQKNEA